MSTDKTEIQQDVPDAAFVLAVTGTSAISGEKNEPECSNAAECATDLACCDAHCTMLSDADQHCGGCGLACLIGQFCSRASCQPLLLSGLCTNDAVVVMHDGEVADDQAGDVLGSALAKDCGQTVMVTAINQLDPTALDSKSGLPLIGPGRTAVFAGGSYFHRGVDYFENRSAISHVTGHQSGGVFSLHDRANGTVIVQTNEAAVNAHHDFFVLELVKEPTKNTLALLAWGLRAPGTTAAGVYLAAQVNNAVQLTHAWIVYEWTDANNNNSPDVADTFVFIAGGT